MISDAKNSIIGFKKILWLLGRHAFWAIIVLVVLEVAFGAFLFYNNAYLALQNKPEIDISNFKFKEHVYKSILNQWEIRQQQLDEFIQEDYISPF